MDQVSPVNGAIAQEAIDLVVVLNALRTARWRSGAADFSPPNETG